MDNTLFNSASLREAIFLKVGQVLASDKSEIGIISAVASRIYDELMREFGIFDPTLFLEEVFNQTGKGDAKEKREIIRFIMDRNTIKGHFHKEVMNILLQLSKIGHLGIYSQGEKKLQRRKISFIKHLLQPKIIHVTRSKKSQMRRIFRKYNNYKIFYIDDRLPMLQLAKEIGTDVVGVWVKRGGYAKMQQPIAGFKPDAQFSDIKKIVELVANY